MVHRSLFLIFTVTCAMAQPSSPQIRLGPDPVPGPRDSARVIRLQGPVAERWGSAGDVFRYRLSLPAGWFARIDVDQCGVDLQLRIDDGRTVAYIDHPNGRFDREWAYLLAEEKDLQVMIAVRLNHDGPFLVRLTDFRPAEPGDQALIEAERHFIQAFQTSVGADPKARLKARDELLSVANWFETRDMAYERGLSLLMAGKVDESTGAWDAAMDRYRGAQAAFRSGGYAAERFATNNLGVIYDFRNDYQQALSYYYRALELADAAGDRDSQISYLNNIGMAYLNEGEYQLALDHFQAALNMPDNSKAASDLLNNIGVIYGALGQPEKSRVFQREALRAARNIGDLPGEFMNLINAFYSHQRLEEQDQADVFLNLAETIIANPLLANYRHIFLQAKALSTAARGDLDAALTLLREAVNQPQATGSTYFQLARTLFDHPDVPPDAEELMQNVGIAIRYAEYFRELPLLVESLALQYKVQRATQTEADPTLIERAATLVEQMRETVIDPEHQTNLFAANQKVFDLYIQALMGKGNPAAALGVMERATARHLMDVLTTGGVAQDLDRESLALFRNYWRSKNRVADLPAGPEATRERRRLARLETQVETSKRSNAKLTLERMLDASQIQALVPDDQTRLLVYHLGDEASYLWEVRRSGLTAHTLPPRTELETLITAAYHALRDPEGDPTKRAAALRALSAVLLGPLDLTDVGRIAVVAGGALQLTPFAALPVDNVMLLERAEVVYLPSVSVLAATRQTKGEQAEELLLAFADPVFQPRTATLAKATRRGGEWGRLPLTRTEAQRIVDLAQTTAPNRTSKSLLDHAASRQAALGSEPEDYRILHFATHGQVDPANPNRTSLILSQYNRDDQPIDGRLSLKDIAYLKLKADLVVLSACETALGKEIRGEGLVSLARGFMFAGVPRVVATLWRADDESTALLMERFYHHLLVKEQSPATALRAAQLEMIRDYELDPYFWAPFVLIGDWR